MKYRKAGPGNIADMSARQGQRISRMERLPRGRTTAVDAANFEIKDGALIIYDGAGNVIVEIGKTSDGRYGLRVNDTTGAAQVRAGQLASTDFGVEAPNGAGVLTVMNVP